MKTSHAASILTTAVLLGACAGSTVSPSSVDGLVTQTAVSMTQESPRQTMLLVSLNDGSIIMQTISSSADVCFKKNSDSATTCLTQGAPIMDPDSNTVIGFEMVEEHIDLVAKAD